MNAASGLKNDKFEISCRTINTILNYLKQEGKDTAEILQGLPCEEKYLTDTNNWISREVENEIFRRVVSIFKDDEVLFKIAQASEKLHSMGFLDHMVRLIAHPQFILKRASKFNSYFTKIHDLEIIKCQPAGATIRYSTKPGYTMTACDCHYTKGMLTIVPGIWGSELAKITEETCAVPIDKMGKIKGKFYTVDQDGYVQEHETARTKNGQNGTKVAGKLNPDGTFKLGNTIYGAGQCLYHISWSPRMMWFKRIFYNIFTKPKVLEAAIEEMQSENDLIEKKYQELYVKNVELQKHYVDTINSLICAIDAKDHYTLGHSVNVSQLAEQIAKKLELDPDKIETIKQACKLHDLGKIGIKDSILLKPDKLTEQEWTEIKKHPVLGAEIIKPLTFLSDVAILIRQDHERWDGQGYPDGLKANQIDIGARVIMLADAYDAMTSGRVYRKKLSKDEALNEIKRNTETQFDPLVVEVFLKIMQEEDGQ
jgi:putative nucleotidyltransferase with HDIG domain